MTKNSIGNILLILAGVIAIIISLQQCSVKGKTHSAERGKELFTEYCAPCHGEKGNGEGELAYLVYPKPRDFTKGVFKLRSTPSGQVPTDEDLLRTIKNGMPGTAMQSYAFLGEEDIKSLVQYVKELSKECPEGKPCEEHFKEKPAPLSIPEPLPYSDALAAKGKIMYVKLGCDKCHGEKGIGDGSSASALKDEWGYPIQVRNFTTGVYLGGGEPKDLYLRFMTGMSGTPMPSFEGGISGIAKSEQEKQEMVWGLIYYIKSLETDEAKNKKLEAPKDGVILAAKIDDGKKLEEINNPNAAIWNNIPSYNIPVSRLWQQDKNNFNMLNVRAVYNGDNVAFLLEWSDTTADNNTYRIQEFQDGAAVQFSLSDKLSFHGMGSGNSAVNIWYWKSDWQMRLAQKTSMLYAYNNKADDGNVSTYPKEIHPSTQSAGKSAGNILSIDSLISPVEDIDAKGPGTLTPQPVKNQNLKGKGVWAENKWKVVYVREFKSGDAGDVDFKEGKTIPVAFAVWNGSQRDRNGQKMVSTWYYLKTGSSK